MCDLINFVLKCTGCNLQVDVHDIEDPDNVTSKLSDLQDEYQAQKITDYPLISKARIHASFRSTMTGFFHSLVATAHAAGLLYTDLALIENIEVWVTTMSSSAVRPFRHTATVISLAIATTMCGLANEISDSIAKTMRQKDGEERKKNVNKDRVAILQAKVATEDKKRETAEGIIRDIFDSVYVHRYRDVDPKIRVDCVAALGSWIATLRDVFFEGQYLRYLGWVLSDTSAPTRAEVVKQLSRLFKRKEDVGRLRAFMDRFRPRLVEMATRDAEPGIRAAVVELLDMVRDAGLLEPDDIDVVGRLIFDTEPRVRKAVAGFFVENINDLFESAVEELGGEEGLGEVLGEEVEDDHDSPKRAWLKLKCLVEVLQSYDENGEDSGESTERRGLDHNESLIGSGVESRWMLAAQAIYGGIPEVKNWEDMAGYLLYDHSSLTKTPNDPEAAFKIRCQLSEREEIILLEVLNVAVKSRLVEAIESESDKKGKKAKARKEESREIQEATALHLAQYIPRLLKKFGANAATASAVLRLEHVLNLEIFQELRQDSTTYSSLLDDINKQFLSHADHGVLAEASTALLHARSFEDLEEVTEAKVQELFEHTIHTFRTLFDARDGDGTVLKDLANTVRRISNLASISDCVTLFDTPLRSPPQQSPTTTPSNPLTMLMTLISSPTPLSDSDPESFQAAHDLITNAMSALLFYHMWLALSLKTALAKNIISTDPLPTYTPFAQSLHTLITHYPRTSPVRLAATGTLLDLHTLFATFRHLPTNPAAGPLIRSLVTPIAPDSQSAILATFAAVEKLHARKSNRSLEPPADEEEEELDLDSEPEDSDEAEDEHGDEERVQHERLVAEKRLCELAGKMVLAVLGKVLDGGVRERLGRNRGRLGGSFREVVAFLEEKGKRGKGAKKGKGKGKVEAVVVGADEDVDVDEGGEGAEEGEVEEGGEEDLRERELVEEGVGVGDGVGEGESEGEGEEAVAGMEDEDVMGD